MQLINFKTPDGHVNLGAIKGSQVINLTEAGAEQTIDALLAGGKAAWDKAASLVASVPATLTLSELKLLPPVLNPSKAIAVGLNYVDHAAESPYKDAPKYPVLFHRFPSSWVAHAADLVKPKVSDDFDYEGEVAVIIGKAGRYISKEDALSHVAGYSIFNDGSIRDYQFKSHQWMMGKNFDATASFGPALVSADELPGGAIGLQLVTRLNGKVLQDANTRDMIFDVVTLVSVCSEAFALQPGDVIISGTPAGVGFAHKPPIFMKAGDVVEVEVQGLGILRNHVVNE
jgi:2-keto-4-pentenoate hydratase/2-oxohepta-3-ene-1,7-dioic acid hydratase in catechol pathway